MKQKENAKEGMEHFSKKYTNRDFKMATKAQEHLIQSVISKNMMNSLDNDAYYSKNSDENDSYFGGQLKFESEGFNKQDKIQKNDKLDKSEAEKKKQVIIANEISRAEKEQLDRTGWFLQQAQSIFNGNTGELADRNEKEQNMFEQLGSQQLKSIFQDMKIERFNTDFFIDESEIVKNNYRSQKTQHFNRQETIQNAQSVDLLFISEEEEDDEESQLEGISEEEQEQDEVYDEYNHMDIPVEKDPGEYIDVKNRQEMDIEQLKTHQDSRYISLNQNQQTISSKESLQKTIIDSKRQQKLRKIRKRDDLGTIPEDMQSFQQTLNKGKKRKLNNGQILLQKVNSNTKNDLQAVELIEKNSKSNLKNMIPQNMSMVSLYENCTNLKRFSEITTLLQQFQYKKQETLICHKKEEFRKIAEIGSGSFGTVDLYEFKPLKCLVAVKTLKTLDEFARELYHMETLQSTYMPQLYYYDEDQKQIYMELGLCSLEDLKTHYEQTGERITDDEAYSLLNQLIVAIELLIQQQAFHSDIKPSNIVFRSKLDENQEITLQLMIIDYGGASFDAEDYWIYYTPAFVCIPLWERLLSSTSANKTEEENVQKQEINYIEESPQQYLSHTESGIINPIYLPTQKRTNLRTLDQQQSQNSNGNLSSTSTYHLQSAKNEQINQNNQDKLNQNLPQIPKINFNLKENNNLSTHQNNQQNSQFRSNVLKQQFQKQYSRESQTDTMKRKQEQLLFIQQQFETTFNADYFKTQNASLERNNENNATENALSWNEIRYSEIYAGCRCIQYLILQKDDTEELFKKKNIDDFLVEYHSQYPKTLKLMYKIFKQNQEFSMSEKQLKSLFRKSSQSDFQITLNHKLIFEISPFRRSIDRIARYF